MQKTIYKVVDKDAWAAARICGVFTGSPIDIEDGYIHLSTAEQLEETVKKHFKGQDDLLLLSVSTAETGDDLKWELSRNDQLFPHLYRTLTINDVTAEHPLPLNKDGSHQFPEEF